MTSRSVTVVNQLGIHARAAAKFVHAAGRVRVAHPRRPARTRDGRQEHHGDPAPGRGAQLERSAADGGDEADAVAALATLVERGFDEDVCSA